MSDRDGQRATGQSDDAGQSEGSGAGIVISEVLPNSGMGDYLQTALDSQRQGRPLEMAFSIEENTWQGRTSLQLKTRDLRLQGQ